MIRFCLSLIFVFVRRNHKSSEVNEQFAISTKHKNISHGLRLLSAFLCPSEIRNSPNNIYQDRQCTYIRLLHVLVIIAAVQIHQCVADY
jgi:hypothetical protein